MQMVANGYGVTLLPEGVAGRGNARAMVLNPAMRKRSKADR
jgi:hypothetical protein